MLRILVADDEKNARDKMIHSIDKATNGLSIVGTASDGFETLDQIISLYPDIVLIDIEMPGLSGLDVVKKVKETNFPVKFIIISSYSDFHYAQNALRLDVEDYLLKPFLPADICTAVYRVAEQIYAAKDIFPLSYSSGKEARRSIGNRMQPPLCYPFTEEHVLLKDLHSGQSKEKISASFSCFSTAVSQKNSSISSKINCFIILYVELHRMIIGAGGSFDRGVGHLIASEKDPDRILSSLSSHILHLCFEIGDYFSTSSSSATAAVNVAIAYIKENYARNLSLAEVAQHVGISASYLSNQFSKVTNMHFVDYIHTIRIEQAKYLLRTQPQLKGYEISEKIGYHSPQYFSSQFKKITGQTPQSFSSEQSHRYD